MQVNNDIQNIPLLFDVSFSLNSASNVNCAQSAALFGALSNEKRISLQGFLYAKENDVFFRTKQTTVRSQAIEYAQYFFHDALGHESVYVTKLLTKLKLKNLFKRIKKQYELYAIDPIYQEVIWRNIFDRDLPIADRLAILEKQFYFTDLNLQFQHKAALNTASYQFVVFPFATPMKIAKDSQKIIVLQNQAEVTLDKVSACLDAYFVCTNQVIQEKLITLFPLLASKSRVILPAFSSPYQKMQDPATLNQVIDNRLVLGKRKADLVPGGYLLGQSLPDKEELLVSAWKALPKELRKTLKFVIHADEMSPKLKELTREYVESGEIIILTHVPKSEWAYLYGAAKLFLFPGSVEENLSFKEALHYECPVLANDTNENRWLLMEAACYGDFNAELSIGPLLTELLISANADTKRAELITKGKDRIKAFSPEVVASEWLSLLKSIRQ